MTFVTYAACEPDWKTLKLPAMKSENSILLVGSVALDTIHTPRESRENLLGGSVSYALISAGKESPVHVVGVVGRDFPRQAFDLYRSYSADLTDFITADGPTFRWGGRYFADTEHRETLFTDLGVFADFNPTLSLVNTKCPWVFLANIHPALQLSVMNQCSTASRFVVDTMNLWIETTPDLLTEVLQRTRILFVNERESELLTGTADIASAAKILQGQGPEIVVIKLGPNGARVFGDGYSIGAGIYPVSMVVDLTGAGDTFGGGFISVLAHGGSLEEALVNGSAWASFCVEGFGTERLIHVTDSDLAERKTYLNSTISA